MQGNSEIERLNNRLAAATVAANIGVWDWDLLTGQVYWTPTLEAIYGLAPGSVRSNEDFRRCVHPDDLQSTEEIRDAAVSRRQPFTLKFRIIRPDGSLRWVEARGRAFHDEYGRVVNIIGTNQDITDRENMEQALRASEERYRTVVEDQTEVIGRVLPDGTLTFANEVFFRVFGTTADAVIGKAWHPITHPDDLPMVLEKLGEMSPDNPVVVIENRNYVAENKLRWMQWVNRGFFDVEGKLVEIQSVGRDITLQKQHETALRESEERLEMALAGSGLALWDWDIARHEVFAGARWNEMLGYAPAELGQRDADWLALIHPADLSAVQRKLTAHLQGETPDFQSEHRLRHRDGHWIIAAAFGKITQRDSAGQPLRVVGTVLEITQRKRLNEEGVAMLRQVETLIQQAMSGSPAPEGQDEAVNSLTRRQRQTIAMIARGMTSAQIGRELKISTATAISHRRELMKKLGLHSTADVTRFALRHKLAND